MRFVYFTQAPRAGQDWIYSAENLRESHRILTTTEGPRCRWILLVVPLLLEVLELVYGTRWFIASSTMVLESISWINCVRGDYCKGHNLWEVTIYSGCKSDAKVERGIGSLKTIKELIAAHMYVVVTVIPMNHNILPPTNCSLLNIV